MTGSDAGGTARGALRGRQPAGPHVAVAAGAGPGAGAGRAGADDRGRPRLEELRLMAHVNLLPWRAERRKQREREFYMQLAAAFVGAVLVLLLWIFWMNQRIDNQNDRNAYLQTEIKQLDVRIAKIRSEERRVGKECRSRW